MTVNEVKTKVSEGWQQNKLSYFATLAGKRYPKDTIPYLEIGDVDVISKSYILKDKPAPAVCLAVELGDVLISKVRPTRGAIVSVKDNLYTSPAFSVLRANNDKKYLFYVLSRQNFINYLGTRETGTTYPSCNDGDILDYKVILPQNLEEQQKIAEILTTIDEVIEKTDAIIEKNKRIKQGLMHDLFRYGIDEHGNIRSEKTHKFKTVKIGNEEMRIPEEWENKRFGDVSVIRQGLQIAISQRKHSSGLNRYQYITIQFLNNRESFNDFIENPPKSVICRKEDILVVRTGNMGVVVTGEDGVFHNNFFLVDFDRSKLDKEWLVYYLGRNEIQNIFQIFAGTTTIPDLKHSNFYDTPCIYPPDIKEQLQITSILKFIDNKISKETVYKQKLLSLKRGLMEDLLTGNVRVNNLMN